MAKQNPTPQSQVTPETQSVPNHFHVIQQLANERPELLQQNTEASILEFMMEAGPRLKAEDPAWGYLTKTAAEKHLTLPNGQFIAVDAFCYQPTQQVVDVLTNAVETSGSSGPAWQVKPKRDINNWYPITNESSGGGEGGGGDPVKDQEQDQRIASLEQQVADLRGVVENTIKYGERIGLQCANGTVLCAEDGGPREDREPFNLTARKSVGAWESWLTHRGQG